MHRDPESGRYVCYVRLFANPDHPEHLTRLSERGIRVIARTENEDFIHWSNPTTVLRWDESDPELNRHIYNMEVLPYEGLYIGFLSVYHIPAVPRFVRRAPRPSTPPCPPT